MLHTITTLKNLQHTLTAPATRPIKILLRPQPDKPHYWGWDEPDKPYRGGIAIAQHSHTDCWCCDTPLHQAHYAHNINSYGEERDSYETRCTNCLHHNPPCQIDAYFDGNLTTTAMDELLNQLKKAIKDDLKWRKEYKQKEKIRTERRYKKACAEWEAQQAAKQAGEQ